MNTVKEYLAKHKNLNNYDYNKIKSLDRVIYYYDPEQQGIPKQYVVAFEHQLSSGEVFNKFLDTTDSMSEVLDMANRRAIERPYDNIQVYMYGDYSYDLVLTIGCTEVDPLEDY